MKANIYTHEFRTRLKSVLTWSLGLAFLVVFFFSLFPVFSDQAAIMKGFLEKYPAELRSAFGLDKADLSTVLGYFSFLFMFAQLCLAIQASNYGVGLVSIEESELTADFLMSKPVSRRQIMTSKLLAALTSLVITDLVVWVCTLISVSLFTEGKTYDSGTLALMLLSVIPFQLFFLFLGLVISLLVKRVRSVTPYGLGLGFGLYVLNGFSGIFGDIKLEYITPFKHFDAASIAQDGAYNIPLVILNLSVTLVALAVSYWRYTRRDIPAVS